MKLVLLALVCLSATMGGAVLVGPFLAQSAAGDLSIRDAESWLLAVFSAMVPGFFAWAGVRTLAVKPLDRTGDPRYVRRGHAIASAGESASLLGLLVVFVLGAPGDGLPPVLGPAVLLVFPVVALFVASVAREPIRRRVQQASLIGRVDRGEPIVAMQSGWRAAAESVRVPAGLVVVPVLVLSEAGKAAGYLAERAGLDVELVTIASSLAAVMLLPTVIARIWPTERLEASPLRDQIESRLNAWRAPVADIRVWNTGGAVANAAVLGAFRPVRQLILSDRVVQEVPDAPFDAIVAHEAAHIRLRHMRWLAIGGIGGALGFAWGLGLLAGRDADWAWWLGALGGGLGVFGVASRAFERQADAFAAARMSGGDLVDTEGAGAMSDALVLVSRLNGVKLTRWTFRHGSIAGRILSLQRITGQLGGATSVDRTAGWIRGMSVVLLVLGIAAELALGG